MFVPGPSCRLDKTSANAIYDVANELLYESRKAYEDNAVKDDENYAAGLHDGIMLLLKALGIETREANEKLIDTDSLQCINMEHWNK